MPVEPREQVTCTDLFGQPVTGGAGWCRRKAAAFVGGTSRVSREAHARICERLGVKFPGPTRHVRGGSSVVSPASPWQNPYVERVIGSIRRECLDHMIVLNQVHLRRVLTIYSRYYHRSRTHLGLEKDAPDPRPVSPRSTGPI